MTGLSSFFNRFNAIKQIPVFSKLNFFEQQKISRKSVIVEYRKGETICKEGTPPDFFYCLISGRLQAYSTYDSGRKDNIEFIHRGMHFGIISLLTGEDHSFTFEALNDSVVLKIPKDEFQVILKSIPQLGIEFSQSLSQRMRRHVNGSKSIFESTIISVYSPVQGTGNSTYAMNLALALEKASRKRVVFVSICSKEKMENQGDVTVDEASPQWKTGSVGLNQIVGDHEKIIASIKKSDIRVDLLNVDFDPQDDLAQKQISLLVSTLVGDYHYVIVDLPTKMDDFVFEALTQSDLVHLITSDSHKDLELIRHVIDRLAEDLKERFREEKIRVIVRAEYDKIFLSFEDINEVIDYYVYTNLPQIQKEELSVRVESKHLKFLRCDERSSYTKAVTHIAREISGVLVGLVLGGGAALGVAHIGVIRVLEEENIPVDMVVGSSIGALIGSFWTTGMDSKALEAAAREFEKKKDLLKLFDPVVPISGLIGGRFIKRWLKKHLGNRTFYSTKIPFKVVAYDLTHREEHVIDSGSIVDAVRQSLAIPGVIEPIRRKERVIIDGGVLNPLPTNVLAGLSIKKIIAINVLQSPDDASKGYHIEERELKELRDIPFLKNPFHYIGFRIGRVITRMLTPNISDIIVRTLQASEYVIAEQSAQLADVVLHPNTVGINWFELDKVDQLIKAGEVVAREHLPQIRKLIEE